MKEIVVTLALVGASLLSYACDCGSYFGVQPQYSKNFAGLRLRYTNTFGNIWHKDGYTNYHSLSTDFWGRFYAGKKVQIFTAVPYVTNQRVREVNGERQNSGLGDITLAAQYRILSRENDSTDFVHVLFAGGGIKLPTGQYRSIDAPGSGSFDFLATADYIMRLGKKGVSLNGSYKLNGSDPEGYKMGDNFRVSANLFWWKKIKSLSLVPQSGISFETYGEHRHHESQIDNTGSSHILFNLGGDIYYNRIAFSFLWQLPVMEEYQGQQLQLYQKITSGISLMF